MRTYLIRLTVVALFLTVPPALRAQICDMVVETVSNLVGPGQLVADSDHELILQAKFWCDNNDVSDFNLSQAFLLYSPDGASIYSVQGGPHAEYPSGLLAMSSYTHWYKVAGTGSWTTVYSPPVTLGPSDSLGLVMTGLGWTGGLKPNQDTRMWIVDFTTSSADAGLHICIDSTYEPPSGGWEWVQQSGGGFYINPEWNGGTGEMCWEIYDPSVVEVAFSADVQCGAVPLTVQFTDESNLGEEITTWLWTFGDGETSDLQNPEHTYSDAGTYDVILHVWGATTDDSHTEPGFIVAQQPVASVDFMGYPQTVKVGSTVAFDAVGEEPDLFLWDFGDSETGTGRNPVHRYNTPGVFEVSVSALQVSGACSVGIAQTKPEYVKVSDLKADFVALNTPGESPLTVAFLDMSEGTPTSWSWDFGDGHTSSDQNPTNEYADVGKYDVQLIVGDGLVTDTLLELARVEVGVPTVDLEAEIYGETFMARPGMNYWYRFVWTNLGTLPAEGSVFRFLLPSEASIIGLTCEESDAIPGQTGTWTGPTEWMMPTAWPEADWPHSGDTVSIPLSTIGPSGWRGGTVCAEVYLSPATPCEVLESPIAAEMWLSTTSGDVYLTNNHVTFSHVPKCNIIPKNSDFVFIGGGSTPSSGRGRLTGVIHLANPSATKSLADPVQTVRVVDTLDPNLDWSTLAVGAMSHPENCDWDFDPATGEIVWYCDDLNLPPNEVPPEGEIYFTFSVSPDSDLPEGTEISNQAHVRMGFEPWYPVPESGPITVTIEGELGCCVGRVGDANGSGDDEPTIGDVTVMIDALFIGNDWEVVPCLAEADINQSGGSDPQQSDITIGDVTYLIDYLFITGTTIGLPDCL